MSRGSRIAIGVVALLGAVAIGMNVFLDDPGGSVRKVPLAIGTAIFALTAIACLVPYGRHVTMRIMAGAISLVVLGTMIAMIVEGSFNSRGSPLFLIASIGAGIYAVRGGYPENWPLAEVFGGQKKKRKGKRKPPDIATPSP